MRQILIVLALAACSKAPAPEATASSCAGGGTVVIADAWVRAQPDAGAMSAAYFTICNGGAALVMLTGAASPAAAMAHLHETTKDAAGAMSMKPAGTIALAPGEAVVFEPGGRHVMLMGLSGPIDGGELIELQLTFDTGETVTAEAVAMTPAEAARAGR